MMEAFLYLIAPILTGCVLILYLLREDRANEIA
jgi:hypothetical protein